MIAMAFSMMLGITRMFFALSQAVGHTLIADESGLSWRKGVFRSRWTSVSWDEVRASRRFARLAVNRNKWEHDAYSCVLDIGDALLTWGVNPFEFAGGGAYTPKDVQAKWEGFATFISVRREVPLHDFTPAAPAIASATHGCVRERKVAQILLAQPSTSEPIAILGLERAVAIVAAEENPQRQRLLRRLSWLPLALFVAIYIVGATISSCVDKGARASRL
jgi:hypothetical protein